MKKILIISFNLIREGENEIPLSIASLVAYLKNDSRFGNEFEIDHKPINLLLNKAEYYLNFDSYLKEIDLKNYDFVAISNFVWNEFLVNPLLTFIKQVGFKGKTIIGGSQITYSSIEKLKLEYPLGDIFISNYGEASLLSAITDAEAKTYYSCIPDFSFLPSPFLSGELPINQNQEMIRWETKRGCPMSCSFCAHRNLENGRVHYMNIEKAFQELSLFRAKNVRRINVLDPIFNIGNSYISVLQEIERLKFENTTFTLQSKIELTTKKDGAEFLNLVERTNSHLEFGLQTLIPGEFDIVNRKNDLKIISTQLELLRSRGISYEVSLIYGLPSQTIDSFKYSIDAVRAMGCENITAWPLMLLKGTTLYDEKEKWALKEEGLGAFNIPVVTSSNTFSKDEWLKMNNIANSLKTNHRI